MNLAGCVGAVVVGAIVDRFQGRMKAAVLASYGLATLSFLLFAYAVAGTSVDRPWVVLGTGVLGGLFLNTPIPLLFELASETTHGVPCRVDLALDARRGSGPLPLDARRGSSARRSSTRTRRP